MTRSSSWHRGERVETCFHSTRWRSERIDCASGSSCCAGTSGEAPDLALDDDDEPAEHRCRLVDRLGTVDELQERGLYRVLARGRGTALGPGGVPQHGGHEVDELREPLALAREVGGE